MELNDNMKYNEIKKGLEKAQKEMRSVLVKYQDGKINIEDLKVKIREIIIDKMPHYHYDEYEEMYVEDDEDIYQGEYFEEYLNGQFENPHCLNPYSSACIIYGLF